MNWLEEKWYALNTELSTKNASVFLSLCPLPPPKARGPSTLARPLVVQPRCLLLNLLTTQKLEVIGLSVTSLQVLTKDATKIYKVSLTV